MKKLLLLLVVAIISAVSASAADTTCRVYGTNNVATIVNTTVYGSHLNSVEAQVELTEKAEKDINVVVRVSDGNRIIATGVVEFTQGYKNQAHSVHIQSPSIRQGETYYLSIASASCQ